MALQDPVLVDTLAKQDSIHFSRLDLQTHEIVESANGLLSDWGLENTSLVYARTAAFFILVAGISFILWWLTRKILIQIIHSFAEKTKTKWDDYLVKNNFFSALAHLAPLLLMDNFMRLIFYSFPRIADFGIRVTNVTITFVIMLILMRFLNTARDVLEERPKLSDKPIASFFQLGKIIVGIILSILIISVAFKINLMVILTSMGALTAVILLVFKDTILGFVGSIQLAANDMVRIGDWVTMERFGADGDVLEINLTTVKVQNFDLTITTIPTYSFISDSFKNWRGMQESGGRRLMRGVNIQIASVTFCTPDMLEKYREIELIREYVEQKEAEIAEFNRNNKVNKKVLVNGRNQTNLGIFRYYVMQYMKNHAGINQDMTLMVRQLKPTETGVGIQIYGFTKTKEWPVYEQVMADIFDHLLSTVPFFELAVFENPTGRDFQRIGTGS
ncbi:MAG: mechanosensitive ion channel domain-containing protein [Crocinitomicaceae bacterium]